MTWRIWNDLGSVSSWATGVRWTTAILGFGAAVFSVLTLVFTLRKDKLQSAQARESEGLVRKLKEANDTLTSSGDELRKRAETSEKKLSVLYQQQTPRTVANVKALTAELARLAVPDQITVAMVGDQDTFPLGQQIVAAISALPNHWPLSTSGTASVSDLAYDVSARVSLPESPWVKSFLKALHDQGIDARIRSKSEPDPDFIIYNPTGSPKEIFLLVGPKAPIR